MAETVAGALRDAAQALAGVSDTPRLDAELLMAEALGTARETMLLRARDLAVPDAFAPLLARRMGHEPVAYIVGRRDFWDLTLAVTPAVLIPRADSECLIEAACAMLADRQPARILDLGTGSGALLLAALRLFRQARGLGIDASEDALAVARANAEANGLGDRADFGHGDWRLEGWAGALGGPFGLVLCNPPYVEAGADLAPQVARFEPAAALYAGPEGLDDYRRILPALPQLVAGDGIAIVELGAGQAGAVAALAPAGWSVTRISDLGGNVRALALQAR